MSVIIPARDVAATLPDTLDGLGTQRFGEPLEVIVVDDGSTDATRAIAFASPLVSRVVELGGVGPAQARNAGAAVARAELLAFLDADCRPTPGWLAAGSAALGSAGLVLGETRPRPDQPCGPFDRTLAVIGCSPLFESANLFVRRDLFERLGGFEGWLGPRDGKELGEDLWLGWRARRSGARIAACAQALAHHAVFQRTARGFVAERWRLRYFPALVRRVPELRGELLYAGVFLNPHAARFDAGLAAVVLATAARRPALGVGAIPYARVLVHDLREPDGAKRAAARLSADIVGLAAMVLGSVRYRTLLI
ncbi:MAG: glycosyltransferase family 2 protein [Solirubrobacteraceae bacterium]